MSAFLTRTVVQLIGRVDGPLHLRLILQPITASILAVRAGIRDAKSGRQPYVWSLVRNPVSRNELVREGFRDVLRVFALSIALDVAYQLIELKWIYPLQSVIVAVVLAILPYVLMRGPIARFVRWRCSGRSAP